MAKPKPSPTTTVPKQAASPDLTSLVQSLPPELQAQLTAGMQALSYQQQDPPVWDGRETKKRSQAYVDFYSLDGPHLRALQERAYQAGLFGTMSRSQIRFGDHDDATLEVWKGLVDRAVGYTAAGKKVSPLDALDEATANPTSAQQPFTGQVTNPLDVRAHLRAAAQDAFGAGKLDDQQVEKFVTSFQAQQQQAQQQSYDQAAGSGGTSVAAPTVDAAADQFLHQTDPVRYDAHKALGAVDQMIQLMRGGQ